MGLFTRTGTDKALGVDYILSTSKSLVEDSEVE